ncbi:MAG: arginine--tRNA ligase [Coriobacteriales bacterium]|nr:arginine--tRNA ligase [Coriobacteriales bacterium]
MRDIIEAVVLQAIKDAVDAGELPFEQVPAPAVERPRDLAHGDWATSVALRNAKAARTNPRALAQVIAAHIDQSDLIESVEIAGPGFINMKLSNAALQGVLRKVHEQGDAYGRCDLGQGRKLQVEFVSANPTGPMHVGHGRWAALGDSLCNVLSHAGWDVEREFYINDAGNQMNIFASSVSVRYQQICRFIEQGMAPADAVAILIADTALEPEQRQYAAELGENSYGGAYIVDIAYEIYQDEGDVWYRADHSEREHHFRERAYTQVLAHNKEVLHSCGVDFDVWFSERSLYEPGPDGIGPVDRAIEVLRQAGHIYQKDGAVWFASTKFGDDKDRVLIKADGAYTYFASDIAYHLNKFDRGFSKVIDIWGADHHGYVPRMKSACTALGHDGQLDVIIGQLVNLLRNGEPVRLSKRAGTMVTFEELLDEVGSDATRYLMIYRSTDQSIDFDIEVAKKQDSTNPVFYVQYAHARICSILRKAAAARGIQQEQDMDAISAALIPDDLQLQLLDDPSELALMRQLDSFGEVLEGAARDYAPFRLTHYAEDLAASFHQFYTQCHVLTDDAALSDARLYAVDASRIALRLVLRLLGVSAPVRM